MRIRLLALVAGLTVSGPALALDTLTPAAASTPTAADQCPVLTQVKYPFLQCVTMTTGGKVLADAGVAPTVAGRQAPYGMEFPEGVGYWGRKPSVRDGRLTDW